MVFFVVVLVELVDVPLTHACAAAFTASSVAVVGGGAAAATVVVVTGVELVDAVDVYVTELDA